MLVLPNGRVLLEPKGRTGGARARGITRLKYFPKGSNNDSSPCRVLCWFFDAGDNERPVARLRLPNEDGSNASL
jgi:hypothetical protein